MINSINIEQSLLGSFMVDEGLCEFLEEINDKIFAYDNHKSILESMKSLRKKNIKIDIPSLYTVLCDVKSDVSISYLTNLTVMAIPSSFDDHIKILEEKATKRELVSLCTNFMNQIVQSDEMDVPLYNFEKDLRNILSKEKEENDNCSYISQKIMDYLENHEVGIKFKINSLDAIIGGLYKGELTTIAAKSGVGKTALALQIMLNVVSQGKKVLFISREMSNEQILMRNICNITGISVKKMKSKNLEVKEWQDIINSLGEFCRDNLIYINDKINTVSQIKRRIRQIKPDLVIIDYLQLLNTENNSHSREREVATLSRDIKNITLDFNIPVIQLSQLNDEMRDARPFGERPMRDSKAIFHDSNNVIYIHQPSGGDFERAIEMLGLNVKDVAFRKKEGIKLVDIIVAKCRDGAISSSYHWYYGPRLCFEDVKNRRLS